MDNGGMTIPDLAAAVFIGNVVTVGFLWSLREAGRHTEDRNVPWWALLGGLLPLLFAAAALLSQRLGQS